MHAPAVPSAGHAPPLCSRRPAVVAVLAAAAVARLSGAGADATWLWAYEIVLALAGAGLCADLLWGRWTQAAVTGVVVDLGDLDREGALRQRLARSVGDPSLELDYWDQVRARYVDAAGEPIELPRQRPVRSRVARRRRRA